MRLLIAISLVFSCLFFSGCGRATERQAAKAQSMLDEADLMMDARLYSKAAENGTDALKRLDQLLEDSPDNVDLKILQVRAQMTIFLANNAVIIDQAEPLPKNLIKMPPAHTYVGYDQTVAPALRTLSQIVNMGPDLEYHQAGFVYGTLGAIYRLHQDTAKDAVREYGRAIEVHDNWLSDLKANEPKVGSNTMKRLRVENQLRLLKLAEAESYLLAEEWQGALDSLQSMVAGADLKFFDTQFKLVDETIIDLENKLREQSGEDPIHYRGGRILQLVQKRTALKQGGRDVLGGRNPYQVELLQAKLQRAELQNNLTYRVICYRRLGMQREQMVARQVLRKYYPELDAELTQLLNR